MEKGQNPVMRNLDGLGDTGGGENGRRNIIYGEVWDSHGQIEGKYFALFQ